MYNPQQKGKKMAAKNKKYVGKQRILNPEEIGDWEWGIAIVKDEDNNIKFELLGVDSNAQAKYLWDMIRPELETMQQIPKDNK